jgi:ribosomal protein L24
MVLEDKIVVTSGEEGGAQGRVFRSTDKYLFTWVVETQVCFIL